MDVARMRELNRAVDEGGRSPQAVAQQLLQSREEPLRNPP